MTPNLAELADGPRTGVRELGLACRHRGQIRQRGCAFSTLTLAEKSKTSYQGRTLTPAAAGAQRCDVQGGRRGRFSTGHAALTTTTGSWL